MPSKSKKKQAKAICRDKLSIASNQNASVHKITKRKRKRNKLIKNVTSLSVKDELCSRTMKSIHTTPCDTDNTSVNPKRKRQSVTDCIGESPVKKFKGDKLQSVLGKCPKPLPSSSLTKQDGIRLKPCTSKAATGSQMLCNDSDITSTAPAKKVETQDLRTRLIAQLQASRFRHLNEELYRSDSNSAVEMFNEDKDAFAVYHKGYQSQVFKWPINPVDKMVDYIKKCGSHLTVADFGCGDAKIARSVKNLVHSFDLVALNEFVTVCDMSKVPLKNGSVDVAVFCLSLMGTNLTEFLCEANRVLKSQGILLIAEVVSRFDNVGVFVKKLKKVGFSIEELDTKTSKMFVWMKLRKVSQSPSAHLLPEIKLNPCVYQRRKSAVHECVKESTAKRIP